MKSTIAEHLRDLRHTLPTKNESARALALIADWQKIHDFGRDLLVPNKRRAAVEYVTKCPVDRLGADQLQAQKAAFDGDPVSLAAMDSHLAAEHLVVTQAASELLTALSKRYAEALAGEIDTARAALLPIFEFHGVATAVDASPVVQPLLAEHAVQSAGGRHDFRGGSPAASFAIFGI